MSIIVELPPPSSPTSAAAAPTACTAKAPTRCCSISAPGSAGTDDASMEKLNDLLYEWAHRAADARVGAARAHQLRRLARAVRDGVPGPVGGAQAQDGAAVEDRRAAEQAEAMLTLQSHAIEDVQDGVPEVLADLRVGVKVWMLTGDKVGTAKNIATACNILPAKAEVLEITCETPALADLKTAEIMMVQDRRRRARGGRHRRGAVRAADAAGGAAGDGSGRRHRPRD